MSALDKDGRRLALMQGLAVIVVGVASHALNSMKAVVVQSYIHSFGVAPSFAGYLLTAEMTAASVGTVFAAAFVNRLKSRAVLGCALTIMLIGNLASILLAEGHPPELLILRVICGLGAGFGLGRLAIAIAFSSKPDRLGGLYSVSSSAFASAGAFAMPALQDWIGRPAVFVVLGLTIPAALLLLRWFPEEGRADGQANRAPLGGADKVVIVVGLSLYYFALGAYWPFVSVIAGFSGLGYRATADVLGWASIAMIAASFVAVFFGDRKSSGALVLTLLGVGILSIGAPLAAPASQFVYMVCACLFTFSWGALFPFLLGLMSRLDPTGRLNGLLYVIAAVGFASGPAVAGWLIGHHHDPLIGARWLQVGSLALLVGGAGVLGTFAVGNNSSAQGKWSKAKASA
jgi:MFS family permease